MLDVLYLSHIAHQEPPCFSISESELACFQEAFAYLREKTGVWIDAYGKCRVYPNHQKILVEYLDMATQPIVIEFVSFLKRAIKDHETLLFDGD